MLRTGTRGCRCPLTNACAMAYPCCIPPTHGEEGDIFKKQCSWIIVVPSLGSLVYKKYRSIIPFLSLNFLYCSRYRSGNMATWLIGPVPVPFFSKSVDCRLQLLVTPSPFISLNVPTSLSLALLTCVFLFPYFVLGQFLLVFQDVIILFPQETFQKHRSLAFAPTDYFLIMLHCTCLLKIFFSSPGFSLCKSKDSTFLSCLLYFKWCLSCQS